MLPILRNHITKRWLVLHNNYGALFARDKVISVILCPLGAKPAQPAELTGFPGCGGWDLAELPPSCGSSVVGSQSPAGPPAPYWFSVEVRRVRRNSLRGCVWALLWNFSDGVCRHQRAHRTHREIFYEVMIRCIVDVFILRRTEYCHQVDAWSSN